MNLTKPQKLIYDMEKYAGGTISIICGSMLSTGKKDTSELKQAVNKIYQFNDALRIRIRENNEEVYQEVVEYAEQEIEVLYFESKTELDAYAEDYAKIPLDFYGDLCEIKIIILPEQYGLLTKLHHMIGDAWTLSLMGTQFHAILNGEDIEAYSYIDYVESENKYIDSKRYEKDRNFFLQQFQKCDEVTYLNEKQSNTLESCRKTFVIENNEAKQIVDYVQKKGTSVFMLFTAILSTYMNRVKMNEEKFYIGTAVLNRNGAKEKNTMGMFVNTVPVLIELDNTKSFAENLTNIEQTLFSVLRHQKYNYGEVLSAIRKEYGFTEKLYDVMISYQNATITGGDSETTWYHSGMQSESLQIHIDDRDNEGIFRIHYDYLKDKFSEHEIEMLHQHMCNLLFDAIRNDDRKLYELEILSEEEQKKLLYEFNDTAIDYPRDKCVHQLFEEQVEKTPDKMALVACDRTLTYAELNAEANKIAHGLIKEGVQVGDIVAFALPRDSYLIATMLGILKAGAAYLPIDLNYPQDRIDFMLEDSRAKVFITKENISEFYEADGTNVVGIKNCSENLCYVLFTSGTTGKPKATQVKHCNLNNFSNNNNNNNNYQSALVNTCTTIVAVTTVVFDISVFEIFVTLLNGLSLVLASDTELESTTQLGKLIEDNKADGIHSTPSKFLMYMDDEVFQKAARHLKMIMVGAEVFPADLIDKISKYTDATVFNGYGPTETTIGVSFSCVKENRCVHQIFEEQVRKTPDKVAVVACDKTLTYKELNQEANRIAHSLIESGVKTGDVVAFALSRKSYLISIMFGILKAGAVYLPIDPNYPQDRIDFILRDSNAKGIITDNNMGKYLTSSNIENPNIWISNESLCYCIYTSGSTGNPKGTLVKHKGIVNLVTNLSIYQEIDKCKVFGFTTTIVFDVATQEIFTALLNSYSGILFPERKETSVDYIVQKFVDERVDVIYVTPTYLDLLAEKECNAIKILKNIKVVVLAGEQFKIAETLQNELENYEIIFENQYGPAETHVVSATSNTKDKNDITIGKPIANTQIYIVDQYMKSTPIGITGELCIAGDGVGAGYLNRPDLTAEKFIDNPFGEGKLYKTGDLAYWREDGNIVYVGRNDFQVKIRGLRIELGEIENVICRIDGISQAIVIVRKNEEGRQLICAFYTGKEVGAKEIRKTIAKKLPKYMVPHIITHLEEIPLTSSGKVNRKALPEVDLNVVDTMTEYVAPKTEKEVCLVHMLEDILGIEKVGILDNFFDVGGDSLKAIELISKLEKQGYHTEIKTIFALETIKELAHALVETESKEEGIEYTEDIPATDAQMRIYTSQNMQQDSTTYNVPYVFKADEVDIRRLQNAIDEIIARHEILRTYFENKDGHIIQLVDEEARCEVEKLDSDDITAFIRPFELSKAPLIRMGVYEKTVMIDMHHIITDGGSMPIFIKELNELYMGRSIENTPIQYKQFAIQKHDYSDSERYWLSVYNDELPVLEINTDFHRGQKQSFCGRALYDAIDIELHNKTIDFCKTKNTTPYVFYMSAFNILLSKYSGNEDIVVGMPISGRTADYIETIGMFVNTIALRNKPVGSKIVLEFLKEVKENSISAIVHQDYPYGELVKKLGVNTQGRNPLFDVMFAYQSEEMTDVIFADKKAELLPIPITTSKYDFTFNVMPREEDVVVMVEYCTDLYKESTMQRLVDSYKLVLEQLLECDKELRNISVISEAEQEKLLYGFNDTTIDYLKEKCVHQMFEEQVDKKPNKEAIIACDKTLTYNELNETANRIAHSLLEKGIGVGDIVAFALHRNSNLIAVILGILKTGAAYLPIDPEYPQNRIDYMLCDSNAKYMITEQNIAELLKNNKKHNPCVDMESDALCYCIYTSGSTGQPKGVLIKHYNVLNFVDMNVANYFQKALIDNCDYILALNSIVFDITLQEVHLPLLNGKTLILLSENEMVDIDSTIYKYKGKNCGLIVTPTKLAMYMKSKDFCKSMDYFSVIMSGAETFPAHLFSELQKYTNAMVFDGYGPTETTCGTLYAEVCSDKDITIGKPIANTQIYIVNKDMQITPIGVTGELCIAGDCVGAGYLNRPELTTEKFIDNPFGEGKLYKTGDLAYWREDGNIVYVGRNDFQVKIRGLRIELGEIENAICEVDGISQSVVVVRKSKEGRQLICAFYTGAELDAKEIRKHIGQKLPKYMLPHICTHLSEMPLTSSGKINRKALPEIDLDNITNETEYVAPENQQQKELCSILEIVLGTTPIGITDDFFDLGGDSLKAIEYVSKAHNEGIYFNLQNVFDYPTVKALCGCIENGDKQEISFADVDFTQVNKILERNTSEHIIEPIKSEVGNILLAGATGYLGIHLLADYLDNDTGIAYCIVRGSDKGNSTKRLKDLLQFYFGDKYADMHRIEVICGDLQKDNFGLDVDTYRRLVKDVDMVINSAASVKHYGSYKYFYEANVETTKRLIEFCKESNAKLIHTSTLSVSGNSFGDQFDGYVSETEKHFYESSLYIEQPLDNVYARSKFEAEKAVLDAMSEGLQANIMRMGNLTNRFSDGVFQKNHESNAFLQRIKSVLELGMVPDYLMDLYTEFTPIDEAANAVMTIARHFSNEQTVFHINSTKVVYMDRLHAMFNKLGFELQIVSGAEFTEALRQTAKQSGMEHIFETFINDMDEDDKLNYDSNIRIENDFTVQYLKMIGFEWSDIDIAYLRKYVEYFKKIGYIR